jgi:chromosome segregation ATPase
MKSFLLVLTLLLTGVSVFLLVHIYKDKQDIDKDLIQERYNRMSAEQRLQEGESRIRKLEAELQSAQVKSSRIQEVLDRNQQENVVLKEKVGQGEDRLRRELEEALLDKAAMERKLREAEQAVESARKEAARSRALAEEAERRMQDQASALLSAGADQ